MTGTGAGGRIPGLNVVAGLIDTTGFVARNEEIIIKSEVNVVVRACLNDIRAICIFLRFSLADQFFTGQRSTDGRL